jgi:hypothetical protein
VALFEGERGLREGKEAAVRAGEQELEEGILGREGGRFGAEVSQQVAAFLAQQVHERFANEAAALLSGVRAGCFVRGRSRASDSVFEAVPGPGADAVF